MTGAPDFQKELEAMKLEIEQVTKQAGDLLSSGRRAFDRLAAEITPKADEAAKAIGNSQKTLETLTASHPFVALAAAFALGAVVGLSLRK